MRIVMVTPDIQIDRRILHEAEDLFAEGHELILLASGLSNQPSYQWVGNVKMERLATDQARYSRSENLMFSIQGRLIIVINRLSTFAQRLICGVAGLFNKLALFMQRLVGGVATIINKVMTWIQRLVGGVATIINKVMTWIARATQRGFTFLAVLVNRTTGLSLRIIRKFTPLPAYERALLDRLVYYDPDIIHVHDLPVLRVGVAGKQKLRVPLIYDAHEFYPEIHSLTSKQSKNYHRLERRLLPQCNHVITVNGFIAEEMARQYKIPVPTVIWNAILPPSSFDPGKKSNRIRKELHIRADRKILLYQGWFSPDRGLGNLVSAMSQVPEDIHLVLMGYGEFGETLNKIASDARISDRVHFKKAVPQDELLFWTASADAGIIPYPPLDLNTRYCSPNKLFEFIQAELPIIVNDLPFLRQVVAGEDFGVVMSLEQPEDFARAITTMFDPSLGGPARFKQNLRARKQGYQWDGQSRKLLEVYQTVST